MSEKDKKNLTAQDGAAKKGEEKGFRAYFVRLFGKYDIRNEAQFLFLGKWLIFATLLFVEALIVLQQLDLAMRAGKWWKPILFSSLGVVLSISFALKLFAIRGRGKKVVFYVLDALLACGFVFFERGNYSLIIYVLVLTGFYLASDKAKFSVWLFCIGMPLYAGIYGARMVVRLGKSMEFMPVFEESLGAIVALTVHFLLVQIALAFYRQFLKLDRALTELDGSKKELEKAYAVVAEVSALEERQRIAKEIHDTAGHSITTVIMQTEAAKRILETNPDEAKNKIIAANLQAKNALEELRDSVHLLSGRMGNLTLKDALLSIIHESTDGTGIIIRSAIDEVSVCETTHRFLCTTLKEGISNGLRHGGATAFWFELKEEGGKIEFLLSDNGKGVGKEALTLGFGLSSMQAHAKSLGGEIAFEGEEGEGFFLHLTLPQEKKE